MPALSARQPQGAGARSSASLHALHGPQPGARTLRDPHIVHVRIDDFAVAVVQRARPDWRERALIVGGDGRGHGAVLAVSQAAREEGVRAGMLLRAAEKLCPQALVVPADSGAVEEAAREVLEILGRYTPVVEPGWITPARGRAGSTVDSSPLAGRFAATLDVYGCERLFGPPTTIAATIGAVLAEHDYSARIGVAGNPALAAVAAAAAPGEYPLTVPAGHEQAFLAPVPLTLFDDIDAELLTRLHALGIRAAGQFARLPEAAVRRRFGQAGRLAHEQARGVAQRPLAPPPEPAALEVACTLEEPTTDGLWLDRELERLAGRLSASLAPRGQSAALLTLTVEGAIRGYDVPEISQGTVPGYERRWRRSRFLHLKQPVAERPAILARARELLAQLAPAVPVESLCLEASSLGTAAVQSTLPSIDPELVVRERLDTVAEKLRARFGPRAACRARLVTNALLPEDRVSWEGPPLGSPVARTRRIEVHSDAATGQLLAVRRDPRYWESLRGICSQWRIRANWWSTPTHRYYYLVETQGGAILEIYQEQQDGSWYLSGRRD